MMNKVDIGETKLSVQDQGTGPVILLVHGFPLDHSMWNVQIEKLSGRFRVVAPDLRGFGGSDVSEPKVTMEQFADDLARLLDALDIRTPVHFCGLSMGGYIAWQFFRKHATRLASLILCDTRAGGDTVTMARARHMMVGRVLRENMEFVAESMLPKLFAESTLRHQPEIVEAIRRTILKADRRGVAAAQLGMAERTDETGLLEHIDKPTLVICGTEDQISPPEEMRSMASAIPLARYIEIPLAGHMAPLENPDTVNEAILEYVI